MKKNLAFLASAVVVVACIGCQSDALSPNLAQNAVSQGFEQALKRQLRLPTQSAVSIRGITENKNDNTALADLTFTGATFVNYGNQCNLTGGKALFRHYSDGRWVLTEIATTEANNFFMCAGGTFRMNIPAS